MYSSVQFKQQVLLSAWNNFGYLIYFLMERFSMNKCIIYDVLDLDVSVSQKAVFKICSLKLNFRALLKQLLDSHANCLF